MTDMFLLLKDPWLKTVRCRDAIASYFFTKVRDEVFVHFHAVALNVTVVCRIDKVAYRDEFLVNNSLKIKENYEHALDFAPQMSRLCSFRRV
jgi:hypothetical protein